MNGELVLYLIGAGWLIALIGVLIFNYAASKQNEILDYYERDYLSQLRMDAQRRSMESLGDDAEPFWGARELSTGSEDAFSEIRRRDRCDKSS